MAHFIIPEGIVLMHEFKAGMNYYLSTEVHRTNENKIKELADVIAFNDNHPPAEGYDQWYLIQAEATDGIHNSTYLDHKLKYRAVAREIVDSILNKDKVDAISVPTGQCSWSSCAIPAISGYPHITVNSEIVIL